MVLDIEERHSRPSISLEELKYIKEILTENEAKSLLEIGTFKGWSLFNLYEIIRNRGGFLIGVDYIPQKYENYAVGYTPEIDGIWSKESMMTRYKDNLKFIKENNLENIQLFIKGSDSFFKENEFNFDCIILHGCHETNQVKKDVKNAIKCINPKGVIILYPISTGKTSNSRKIFNDVSDEDFEKEIHGGNNRIFGILKKKKDLIDTNAKNHRVDSSTKK